ncbi:hypothetical protein [Glutamicibacter sp. TV12E]|uniref:hypothetical protein n=1 Tax=Glutamicibacter sp. TV12E TaxID=3446362 RepID=UPI004033CAB4
MEDTSAETTSDLFKIVRAVDGDTSFRLRVEIALELEGKDKNRTNVVYIAKAVVGNIDCTVEGTVNTERVTDAQIMEAIATLPAT